jgi:hypothetical protein
LPTTGFAFLKNAMVGFMGNWEFFWNCSSYQHASGIGSQGPSKHKYKKPAKPYAPTTV